MSHESKELEIIRIKVNVLFGIAPANHFMNISGTREEILNIIHFYSYNLKELYPSDFNDNSMRLRLGYYEKHEESGKTLVCTEEAEFDMRSIDNSFEKLMRTVHEFKIENPDWNKVTRLKDV